MGFIHLQRYYINADSTKIWLAYVFNKDSSTKSTQYLLYTVDPADKDKFINYEQFIENQRDLVEFNAFFWTYICVDNEEQKGL